MRILGEMLVPGIISAVTAAVVRTLHIILNYRLRRTEIDLHRMEIELRREQLGFPGRQPAKAYCARHTCRRRRLR